MEGVTCMVLKPITFKKQLSRLIYPVLMLEKGSLMVVFTVCSNNLLLLLTKASHFFKVC